MSNPDEPYLIDVGVVALAHADTPVSDRALSCLRDAIRGDINAVVPYSVVLGAHAVLTGYYGFDNATAADMMLNFMDSKRIDWRERMSETDVRAALARSAELDIDAWDGYYADVALGDEVNTVLTLDDTFDGVDGVTTEVILSPAEYAILNDFLSS